MWVPAVLAGPVTPSPGTAQKKPVPPAQGSLWKTRGPLTRPAAIGVKIGATETRQTTAGQLHLPRAVALLAAALRQ